MSLVGRYKEREILYKALKIKESEFIAITGRRRIGKTYLIKQLYSDNIRFEIRGIQDADLKQQLENFKRQMIRYFGNKFLDQKWNNWFEAFTSLELELEFDRLFFEDKPVIFFDELPWIAGRKSGFVEALSHFWNNWAVNQNVVVVICGSSASWMIQKIYRNRGSLYNRVSQKIILQPFSLKESEEYLRSRNITLNHYQLLQLYMVLGGVPYYLKAVEQELSASQTIQKICFEEQGILRYEFNHLYHALFDKADVHMEIVRTLNKFPKGLTRQELIKNSNLSDGGRLNKYIDDLLHSGFINTITQYNGKNKDKKFRLHDEYSRFYLKFIEGHNSFSSDYWQLQSVQQSFRSWSGFAFENLCIKHYDQIKQSLGLGVISASFCILDLKSNKDHPGIQVDMIIKRADHITHLCEIKFYSEPILVSTYLKEDLLKKKSVFQFTSKTKDQLFITLISPFGILDNENSLGLIDQSLSAKDLFI